jgi:hypothetical protein
VVDSHLPAPKPHTQLVLHLLLLNNLLLLSLLDLAHGSYQSPVALGMLQATVLNHCRLRAMNATRHTESKPFATSFDTRMPTTTRHSAGISSESNGTSIEQQSPFEMLTVVSRLLTTHHCIRLDVVVLSSRVGSSAFGPLLSHPELFKLERRAMQQDETALLLLLW